MSEQTHPVAWLERADGERVKIVETCAIGRAETNQLVLNEAHCSRRHAEVQMQSGGECWLVDFGSRNGTYLNGRRIVHPALLRDGDQILIGDTVIVFHNPDAPAAAVPALGPDAGETMFKIRMQACWLLVLDIEGATRLSQSVAADELILITGRWFAACKVIIEQHDGCINKYLGDGLFAYWPDRGKAADNVVLVLNKLEKLQRRHDPPFRVILHHGVVSVGGSGAIAEESLGGAEVNYVFRMEKLAGQLKLPRLMSDRAHQHCSALLPTKDVGRHALSSFEGDFAFFSFY